MNDLEKEVIRFYQENYSWVLSEYEGDLKHDTMMDMAIEWTIEDCVPLIKDIVKNYLSEKA